MTWKRIAIIAITAITAGIIIGITATPAAATGVHHPQCDGILIKDQPPYTGLSVTATHTGTMWLKIGNQHIAVQVTAGETHTPASISSWPTNRNGRPQDISHVDYCTPNDDDTTTSSTTTTSTVPETTTTVAETTTTTTPTETTTTTTQPGCVGICGPATPPSTVALPDVCLMPDGSILDQGEYVSGGAGTTRHHINPCGPPATPVAPPAGPAGSAGTLPATGNGWVLFCLTAAGAVFVLMGWLLLRTNRDRSGSAGS